jgi:hypothetical protein
MRSTTAAVTPELLERMGAYWSRMHLNCPGLVTGSKLYVHFSTFDHQRQLRVITFGQSN